MLERITQTKLILDQANPKTRKMLNAAIAVQTPLVERMRVECFCEDFRNMATQLELPIPPSQTVVAFAAEVAVAWDGLSLKERHELGLPPIFSDGPHKLGYVFFGTNGNCNQRLGMVIHNAERLHRELGIYTLVKKVIGGTLGFEQFKKGMQKFGITIDGPFDIKQVGDGLIYTGRTEFSRVTAHVPHFDKALADSEKTELGLRLEIARRLTVGYNPAL